MKKIALFVTIALSVCSAVAQSTERKFVLKNSADGGSEITVYLPKSDAAAAANGRAIVDCPGGGYTNLSMQFEGHDWAEFYNAQGIAYVVLKYRMPKGDRNIPLSDAYNAIRTVRDSAQAWHINPYNVGIQGFSAGGHLASAVSTHAPMPVRPDFSILFYPVTSMWEKETHSGSVVSFLGDDRTNEDICNEWTTHKAVRRHLTPPAVIILASDDTVVPPGTNGGAYYVKMCRSGNRCAMYAYPSGGHGFGFRSTFKYHDNMLNDLKSWLAELKMPVADSLVKVACVGNSITDGVGIEGSDQRGYPATLNKLLGNGFCVKNFGVSGRTMSNSGNLPYCKEQAWRDCLDWQPDVVVIKLGTNDTKAINWPTASKDYIPSLKIMVDSLQALPTNPRIVLCTPIPAFQTEWTIRDSVIVNGVIPMLQKFATENNLELIDLHTPMVDAEKQGMMTVDRIHPNVKGASKIAHLVADQLRKERPAQVKKAVGKNNKNKKK
ncbi:MAG: alpha/beta hydrolase fold domain-containing protein [Bacteroidales bacterium]|nr:alpha/beta hydrolase fold domain-containing protein [Bacteroidales bacterium]